METSGASNPLALSFSRLIAYLVKGTNHYDL